MAITPKVRAEVALRGEVELQEKFARIVEGTKDKELVEIVEPAADIVQEQAEANAPVDTGALRDAIMKRATVKAELNVKFSIGWDAEEAPYGGFQELGWTDKDGEFHTGNPFLRPAADTKRDAVTQRVGYGVEKVLNKETED